MMSKTIKANLTSIKKGDLFLYIPHERYMLQDTLMGYDIVELNKRDIEALKKYIKDVENVWKKTGK